MGKLKVVGKRSGFGRIFGGLTIGSMREERQWVFGSFRLDPADARLWHGTEAVALAPKAYAVLCHLVEHASRLVTKDELLDAIWQRRFVSESVLKDCINELRKALGDDARAPQYIETVARRGYRFIAELSPVMPLPYRAGPGHILSGSECWIPPDASGWVGREGSLHYLQTALERMGGGERRVVFVSGEAGIGKTTLLQMFLAHLATSNRSDAPLIILWGQCIEQYGPGEPLLPVLQALSQCCRAAGAEQLITVLRERAPTWLAQMPWALAADERDALARGVLGATRERMLHEFCEFLAAISRATPLVLILEDLQWADYATVDLLSLLARQREPAKLLVCGTFRPVELTLRGHPFKGIKQELQLHSLCTELALDPLSEPDVANYLKRRFSESHISDELAAMIHRRTEGHPLFMVSLVDYLLSQGSLVVDGRWVLSQVRKEPAAAIPDNVQQMILHEIARRSAEERKLLEAASVAGTRCSAAILAYALEADLVAVEDGCEGLARQGHILARSGLDKWSDGTVCGHYSFLHALYSEALYQRIPPARKAQLHRRVGECLEKAYKESGNELAAELASHFEQSHDPARALKYLREAARQAARRFSNREAIAYLTRALGLVASLPEADRVTLQLDLLQQLGALRKSAGQMREAAEDFGTMLAYARGIGHRAGEVRALVELSRIYIWIDRQRCLTLAEEAVERSEALSDELTKLLVKGNRASWNILLRGWRLEDDRICRLALDAACRTGDPRTLNTRLAFQSIVESICSNYRVGFAVAEEGMQAAQIQADAYQFMICQYWRIWPAVHLGLWGEARRTLSEALDAAKKNSNPLACAFVHLLVALLHAEALAFEEAARCCHRAFEFIPYGQEILISCLGDIVLAKSCLGRADTTHAIRYLDAISRRVRDDGILMEAYLFPPFLHTLSGCALAQGDTRRACREAERLCELAAGPPERTYLALGYNLLAQVALLEGRTDEAHIRVGEALQIVQQAEVPLAAWRVYTTAAELAAYEGNSDKAEVFTAQGAAAIRSLAASLDEADPLRAPLLAHPLLESDRPLLGNQ